MAESLPLSHDKLLFTPGPLTTSLAVKAAMLHDAGSWHFEFSEIVRGIRQKLLAIAGVSEEKGYESILMQGSGTFAVESVVGSAVPPNGKLLVLVNGAYGERMLQMATRLKINTAMLRCPENQRHDLTALAATLAADPAITHVAAVHCETTTGILNLIEDIGRIAKDRGCVYVVDAMSSFGAIPIDAAETGIDFLVASANKCLEGVPGFGFVIAKRSELLAIDGFARSVSLDLLGQWKGFQKNGQFRFTPPTHAILAFEQALREFDAEGGTLGRAARYQTNHRTLVEGMKRLGFHIYLEPDVQSYIITSFYYPTQANFRFAEFYRRLSEKGMIIYPGKLSQVDCFRIGNIGRIFEADIRCLLNAIEQTLTEMNVSLDTAVELSGQIGDTAD